jgi:hypothetical protein
MQPGSGLNLKMFSPVFPPGEAVSPFIMYPGKLVILYKRPIFIGSLVRRI